LFALTGQRIKSAAGQEGNAPMDKKVLILIIAALMAFGGLGITGAVVAPAQAACGQNGCGY
jgi:hypothetical protein